MKPCTLFFTLALAASTASPALADCPVTATETQEILKAFPAAQAAERAKRPQDALELYVKAQGFICDGNPNAPEAARRAAALAKPLAVVAEQQGRIAEAFTLYEQGGYYAAADRALLAHLRQHADDVNLVGRYISHFADRSLPAFAENHRNEIAAAGAYAVDAALRRELEAMPAKGIERSMSKENTAFNEQYLSERMRLVQSRPEATPAAMASMQAAVDAEQAFARKWPSDLLKESQDQLRLARQWAVLVPNGEAVRTQTDALALARAKSRAATLVSKYAGAPEFLEAAADYYRSVEYLEPAEARVAQIAQQATTLGDQARAKGRYALAIGYYEVAGQDARAEAVRAEQQQAVMKQMQPEIDAARRAAEAVAAQFGDPAVVEAMKKQAEAARAAAEAARKSTPASRQKDTADLERELGLR